MAAAVKAKKNISNINGISEAAKNKVKEMIEIKKQLETSIVDIESNHMDTNLVPELLGELERCLKILKNMVEKSQKAIDMTSETIESITNKYKLNEVRGKLNESVLGHSSENKAVIAHVDHVQDEFEARLKNEELKNLKEENVHRAPTGRKDNTAGDSGIALSTGSVVNSLTIPAPNIDVHVHQNDEVPDLQENDQCLPGKETNVPLTTNIPLQTNNLTEDEENSDDDNTNAAPVSLPRDPADFANQFGLDDKKFLQTQEKVTSVRVRRCHRRTQSCDTILL